MSPLWLVFTVIEPVDCSPWWPRATHPVCCADGGWTDSLPDLSGYTNTVSRPIHDL